MGRIIVGVDGSAASGEALDWAAREGRQRDWSVTAVLVWTEADRRDRHAPATDSGRQDLQAGLARFVADTVPEPPGPIECRVEAGLAAPGLLRAAAGADLLVVGARGYGGFRGLLLGSVSQQCAQHTTVPIAIVRAAAEPPNRRIIVGIDGSADAQRALRWALDAARAHSLPVTVLHAWRRAVLGAFDFAAPVLTRTALEATARRTVEEALAAAEVSGVTVDTAIVESGAAKALLASARDASLVVVASRGLGGFAGLLLGSVTQKVLNHAACSVVVVPSASHDRRRVESE